MAGQRVIIVRKMRSLYYLGAAAAAGSKTLQMRKLYFPDGFFFKENQSATLSGANPETVRFKKINTATGEIELYDELRSAHTVADTLEFPAAGWSGNPVVLAEGDANEDELKWTLGHELGHSILCYKDLNDTTNVMHFQQGHADHRQRYKPKPLYYKTGEENQWETVPR